ncbi:hypothetical protein C8J56DRAFT_766185, partial [Mycena floridula]
MEQIRGLDHGSYIWGQSVHNIWIERLWVDVTQAFGGKWKSFFIYLEINHGLNRDLNSHIWLLHHLFLHHINEDIRVFICGWNYHTVVHRVDQHQSPVQMYTLGVIRHGQRGVFAPLVDTDPDLVDPEEIDAYGIDEAELVDRDLCQHHREQN